MKYRRNRTMYKNVDHDVEIEVDDVLEYINDYATDNDLRRISAAVNSSGVSKLSEDGLFADRGMEGTYVRGEKLELLSAVFHQFSLEELEQRLGTKFNLKMKID